MTADARAAARSPAATVVLRPDRLDSPFGRRLVEAVQGEYVVRYGGPDTTPLEPEQFTPPGGLFLVAWRGDEAVGCGGYRRHADGVVELKRMYVAPAARRQGVARLVLRALEDAARAAGHARVVLESGSQQPEALALYAAEGYRETAAFGVYACAPEASHLAKDL